MSWRLCRGRCRGAGLLKRAGMRRELAPEVLAMQDAVKRTLNPAGLFNPGKVVGDPAV